MSVMGRFIGLRKGMGRICKFYHFMMSADWLLGGVWRHFGGSAGDRWDKLVGSRLTGLQKGVCEFWGTAALY
jgi:hypothetical protein